MENFLMNKDIFVVLTFVAIAGAILVYKFFQKTDAKKQELILKWLLQAVLVAEKKFGKGKGAQKLEYVYNVFSIKFPIIRLLISKNKFAKLVDQALDIMEETLKEIIEKKK